MSLSDKKCVPCEGGTPPLTKEETDEFMIQINDEWQLEKGKKIMRDFKFKDFARAMEFVNKIAEIAESEGHHPDFIIRYNKVKIELTTHAIGGLSENDFIMASKIDQLT